MISYKILHTKDMNRSLFDHLIRHQTVIKCWRREHGSWIIRDDPFTDDWSEDDYRQLISHLKSLLCSTGFVCGAFYQNTLKGFVSEDMRRMGMGIGRTHFLTAESQAFYRSIGCVDARIYSRKHVEEEPYDCQMEYVL